MRGLTSTLILVVVLAGLGGYIYFVDSKRPAPGADGSSAAKEKVFTVAGTLNCHVFEPETSSFSRISW